MKLFSEEVKDMSELNEVIVRYQKNMKLQSFRVRSFKAL